MGEHMSKHLLGISTYGRILGLVLQEAEFGRKFTTAVATRRDYPFGASWVLYRVDRPYMDGLVDDI
jgi:hypothetical protein